MILELPSIGPLPTIETTFEIIYLLYFTPRVGFNFPENIFHTDEVNGIDFLFVLIYFQLVKAIDPYN